MSGQANYFYQIKVQISQYCNVWYYRYQHFYEKTLHMIKPLKNSSRFIAKTKSTTFIPTSNNHFQNYLKYFYIFKIFFQNSLSTSSVSGLEFHSPYFFQKSLSNNFLTLLIGLPFTVSRLRQICKTCSKSSGVSLNFEFSFVMIKVMFSLWL